MILQQITQIIKETTAKVALFRVIFLLIVKT